MFGATEANVTERGRSSPQTVFLGLALKLRANDTPFPATTQGF